MYRNKTLDQLERTACTHVATAEAGGHDIAAAEEVFAVVDAMGTDLSDCLSCIAPDGIAGGEEEKLAGAIAHFERLISDCGLYVRALKVMQAQRKPEQGNANNA